MVDQFNEVEEHHFILRAKTNHYYNYNALALMEIHCNRREQEGVIKTDE